ncbi:MAG TPA: ABC transporter ATP-binding protein [Burkholderiaceae bacterium]|nr:ABC transporter ATP-binding protein [Burkholderiaceae bacterium]
MSATPDPGPAATPTLAARGLCVAFGTGFGAREVLRGVDLELRTGWTAIVGPNGAGKSTLLRALAGLLPLRAGQVRLHGQDLATLSLRQRAQQLAWLSQGGENEGELSVRETVALGRLPHIGLFGAPDAADERAVDAAMQAMACNEWQHRRLPELSGGERQRVLLARALATEAGVLLLDEPTTHMDPPHQVALIRLLRRIAPQRTVLSVLHDLNLALHADRLIVMDQGRVVAEGAQQDPRLHAALSAVFGGAIQIRAAAPAPVVSLVQ